MQRITRIEEIRNAALERRALFVPGHRKPIAAAFVINLQGHILCRWLEQGIFIYDKKPKDRSAWYKGKILPSTCDGQ